MSEIRGIAMDKRDPEAKDEARAQHDIEGYVYYVEMIPRQQNEKQSFGARVLKETYGTR